MSSLSSLESSDCGRSPLLLALITDGNATDDSGIDSICCDSAVSPSGGSTITFCFFGRFRKGLRFWVGRRFEHDSVRMFNRQWQEDASVVQS